MAKDGLTRLCIIRMVVTVYKNEPTGDSQFSEYNDGYLVYDFDIGDYSEFVDYANYIPENEEESEPDII